MTRITSLQPVLGCPIQKEDPMALDNRSIPRQIVYLVLAALALTVVLVLVA